MSKQKHFGLNTEVDDRNANKTETQKTDLSVKIYYARNISPDGKECGIYKSYIDFNDDGNIDFIF